MQEHETGDAQVVQDYRKAVGKALLREGFRAFAIMAACHLVALVLSSLTLSETVWLSIVSTVVLLAIYALLGWADGASRGEKAVAMNEMIESQRKTYQREPDENQVSAMYQPKRGWKVSGWILAFTIAVVLILTVIFLLLSDPQANGFLASLEFSTRLIMVPFFGVFTLMGASAVWILPFCFLIFPAAELIGYLSGPRQRRKVHKAIEDHAERVRKKQIRERALKKGAAAKRPPKR